MKSIWIDKDDERTTKRLIKFLAVCVAVVAVSALFWTMVGTADADAATETCYPASECQDGSSGERSDTPGYPLGRGATNPDPNYQGFVCLGAGVITGAAAAAGGAVSGGSGAPVAGGATAAALGGATNCYYLQALSD